MDLTLISIRTVIKRLPFTLTQFGPLIYLIVGVVFKHLALKGPHLFDKLGVGQLTVGYDACPIGCFAYSAIIEQSSIEHMQFDCKVEPSR